MCCRQTRPVLLQRRLALTTTVVTGVVDTDPTAVGSDRLCSDFSVVFRDVVPDCFVAVFTLTRYAATNPHFLLNLDFIRIVKECQQDISKNKEKSYVYLAQFNKTLKEYPAATMKHLLAKNGTRIMPEVEDDLQCEKLLNSLAKQQKQQQSATEKSLPPLKRQRLLGVNVNNEVIIADSLSGPSDLLPNKPLSSQNRRVTAFFGVPTKPLLAILRNQHQQTAVLMSLMHR